MKIMFSLCLVLSAFQNSYAQLKSIIVQPYTSLTTTETISIHTLNSKKKSIFINNIAIDSVGGTLDFVVHNNRKLFGSIYRKGKHFLFSIDQSFNNKPQLKQYKFQDGMLNTDKYLYTVDRIYFDSIERRKLNGGVIDNSKYLNNITSPHNKRLSLVDLNTGSKKDLLFDLDSIYSDSISNYSINQIQDLFELDENRLFLSTAFCLGGCELFDHFIYDRKLKKIDRVNFLKRWEADNTFYHITVLMKDKDSEHFLVEYDNYGVKNPLHFGLFIIDKNLNIVSRSLPHRTKFIGYNYRGSKLISYNLNSNLDNGNVVIIPFSFNYQLEISLQKIVTNEELLKSETSSFNKEELSILRNAIFAKHNFKFNDTYDQAYYNLFDFYNSSEKRNKRLAKVDHLFTSIDKKNLEAINKLLLKR